MARKITIEGQATRAYSSLSRWIARLAVAAGVLPVLLAMAVSLVPALAQMDRYVSVGLFWVYSWFATPFITAVSAIAGRTWNLGPATAELDASGVVLTRRGSVERIAAEQIAGALVVCGFHNDRIELTTRGGTVVTVAIPDEKDGHEAIEALGLGASGRRVAIPLGDSAGKFGSGCAALLWAAGAVTLTLIAAWIFHLLGDPLLYVLGLVFVGTAAIMQRRSEGRRVVVGSDGILFDDGFRSRFYPIDEIQEVRQILGTMLIMKDGRRVRLSGGGAREVGLAARIEEARRRARDPSATAAESLPSREGRTLSDWRQALAALTRKSGGYRNVPMTVEGLLSLASDASLSAERRLAAAIAARASGDPEVPKRLRFTAEGLANERLRIAMQKAADDELEDEALEEALAEEKRPGATRS